MTWGGYRDTVWICKDRLRKGKVKMKQGLERDVKHDKKGFIRISVGKNSQGQCTPDK